MFKVTGTGENHCHISFVSGFNHFVVPYASTWLNSCSGTCLSSSNKSIRKRGKRHLKQWLSPQAANPPPRLSKLRFSSYPRGTFDPLPHREFSHHRHIRLHYFSHDEPLANQKAWIETQFCRLPLGYNLEMFGINPFLISVLYK